MINEQETALRNLIQVIESVNALVAEPGEVESLRQRLNGISAPPVLGIIGDKSYGIPAIVSTLTGTLVPAEDSATDSFENVTVIGVELADAPRALITQIAPVVFLLNSTRILALDERRLIDNMLGSQNYTHVFFVVLNANQVSEEDKGELRTYLNETLEDYYETADELNRHVFFVDARAASQARNVNDASGVESSGFAAFERALKDYVRTSASVARARMTAEAAVYAIAAAFKRLETARAQIKPTTITNDAELAVQRLQKQRAYTVERFDRFGTSIQTQLEASLQQMVKQMETGWDMETAEYFATNQIKVGELVGYAFSDAARRMQVEQELAQGLIAYFQHKLDTWTRSAEQKLKLDAEMLPSSASTNDAFIVTLPNTLLTALKGKISDQERARIAEEALRGVVIGSGTNWIFRLAARITAGFMIVISPFILLKVFSGVALVGVEMNSLRAEGRTVVGSIQRALRDEAIFEFKRILPDVLTVVQTAVEVYNAQRREVVLTSLDAEIAQMQHEAQAIAQRLASEANQTSERSYQLDQAEMQLSELLSPIYRAAYPNAEIPDRQRLESIRQQRAVLLGDERPDAD